MSSETEVDEVVLSICNRYSVYGLYFVSLMASPPSSRSLSLYLIVALPLSPELAH